MCVCGEASKAEKKSEAGEGSKADKNSEAEKNEAEAAEARYPSACVRMCLAHRWLRSDYPSFMFSWAPSLSPIWFCCCLGCLFVFAGHTYIPTKNNPLGDVYIPTKNNPKILLPLILIILVVILVNSVLELPH